MKPKSFALLVILLCVLASITFFVLRQENPSSQTTRMGEPLFTQIPLEDIMALRISSHEADEIQTVSLKKADSEWVVENLFNFPANFKSIWELVSKLKDSKIGRRFEASDDSLSRLALHAPGTPDISPDKKAVRIEILGKDQKPIADVLIGKQRESSSGDGSQYLKPTGENTVYLVDQIFWVVGKQPRDWIKTDLLDIPPADIESVTCIDPMDQSVIYSLKRPEKGAFPAFHPPQEDKVIKKRMVDALFDSLSPLNIQDVGGPVEEISEEITGFGILPFLDFQLFDGTLYRVYLGNKIDTGQNGYYFKAEVSQTRPEETSIDINHLYRNLSRWVYIISDWEHQSMVTEPEAFFENTDNEE